MYVRTYVPQNRQQVFCHCTLHNPVVHTALFSGRVLQHLTANSVQLVHTHQYTAYTCIKTVNVLPQPMLLPHKCSDTYLKTTWCFVNVSVLNDPWNPPHCRKGNCKRNHDMTLKGLARVQAGITTAM